MRWLFFLPIISILSCTTTMRGKSCRKVGENMKVCPFASYSRGIHKVSFCKLVIDRKGIYPDTETSKFRCEGAF